MAESIIRTHLVFEGGPEAVAALENYVRALREAQTVQKTATGAAERLAKAMNTSNATLLEGDKAVKQYGGLVEQATIAIEQLASKLKFSASMTEKQRDELVSAIKTLQSYRSAVIETGVALEGLIGKEGEAVGATNSETLALERQLRAIALNREAMVKYMNQHNNFVERMAASAPRLSKFSLYIGAGIAGAAYEGIKLYQDLDKTMTQTFSQANVSMDKHKALMQNVRTVAKETGRSYHDVADALYRVASATSSFNKGKGASTRELNALTRQATNLMVLGNISGGANADAAARIIGAVANTNLRDFRRIANPEKKSAAIAATMNAIVGSGDIRMSDLISALGRGVLTSAASVGLGAADTGAFIDLLTSKGTAGAPAGTYVAHAFQLLAGSTAQNMKWQEAIGLKSGEMLEAMKTKGLAGASALLREHMKQLVGTDYMFAGSTKNRVYGADAAKYMMEQLGMDPRLVAEWQSGVFKKPRDQMTLQERTDLKAVMQREMTAMFGGGRQAMPLIALMNNPQQYSAILEDIKKNSTASVYNRDLKLAMNTPARQQASIIRNIQDQLISFGEKMQPIWLGILNAGLNVIRFMNKFKGYWAELGAIVVGILGMVGTRFAAKGVLAVRAGAGALDYYSKVWSGRGAEIAADEESWANKYANKHKLRWGSEGVKIQQQIDAATEMLTAGDRMLAASGSFERAATLLSDAMGFGTKNALGQSMFAHQQALKRHYGSTDVSSVVEQMTNKREYAVERSVKSQSALRKYLSNLAGAFGIGGMNIVGGPGGMFGGMGVMPGASAEEEALLAEVGVASAVTPTSKRAAKALARDQAKLAKLKAEQAADAERRLELLNAYHMAPMKAQAEKEAYVAKKHRQLLGFGGLMKYLQNFGLFTTTVPGASKELDMIQRAYGTVSSMGVQTGGARELTDRELYKLMVRLAGKEAGDAAFKQYIADRDASFMAGAIGAPHPGGVIGRVETTVREKGGRKYIKDFYPHMMETVKQMGGKLVLPKLFKTGAIDKETGLPKREPIPFYVMVPTEGGATRTFVDEANKSLGKGEKILQGQGLSREQHGKIFRGRAFNSILAQLRGAGTRVVPEDIDAAIAAAAVGVPEMAEGKFEPKVKGILRNLGLANKRMSKRQKVIDELQAKISTEVVPEEIATVKTGTAQVTQTIKAGQNAVKQTADRAQVLMHTESVLVDDHLTQLTRLMQTDAAAVTASTTEAAASVAKVAETAATQAAGTATSLIDGLIGVTTQARTAIEEEAAAAETRLAASFGPAAVAGGTARAATGAAAAGEAAAVAGGVGRAAMLRAGIAGIGGRLAGLAFGPWGFAASMLAPMVIPLISSAVTNIFKGGGGGGGGTPPPVMTPTFLDKQIEKWRQKKQDALANKDWNAYYHAQTQLRHLRGLDAVGQQSTDALQAYNAMQHVQQIQNLGQTVTLGPGGKYYFNMGGNLVPAVRIGQKWIKASDYQFLGYGHPVQGFGGQSGKYLQDFMNQSYPQDVKYKTFDDWVHAFTVDPNSALQHIDKLKGQVDLQKNVNFKKMFTGKAMRDAQAAAGWAKQAGLKPGWTAQNKARMSYLMDSEGELKKNARSERKLMWEAYQRGDIGSAIAHQKAADKLKGAADKLKDDMAKFAEKAHFSDKQMRELGKKTGLDKALLDKVLHKEKTDRAEQHLKDAATKLAKAIDAARKEPTKLHSETVSELGQKFTEALQTLKDLKVNMNRGDIAAIISATTNRT